MDAFVGITFIVTLISYVVIFFKETDYSITLVEFGMRWLISVFFASLTTFALSMIVLAVFK